MPSGIVSFPGIDQILSATVSYGRGIRPSITQIEIAPQLNFVALTGNLVWADQNGTATFFDCRVDIFSFVYDQRGLIWQLRILDRRWKWDYPTISGHYNLRHDSGNLIQDATGLPDIIWDTVLNAQQLAALCLNAMGETGYDVSALPSNAFPLVSWENEKAAVALEQLCENLGCHIVINSTNSVVICKVGVGAALPINGQVLANSGSLDVPEVPDKIVVLSAPVRTQADFFLEAVGKELNGDIKLVEDLSYAPADLWSTDDLYRRNLAGAEAEQARRTVWRMYRVQTSPPPTINTIDQDGNAIQVQLTDPLQIAPIEDNQCYTIAIDGHVSDRPAMVWGVYYGGTEGRAPLVPDIEWIDPQTLDQVALFPPGTGFAGNQAQQYCQLAIYNRGFTLDREKLIVIFSEPVYNIINDPTDVLGTTIQDNGTPITYFRQIITAASLVLRVAFSMRDPVTRAFRRYRRSRDTGANNGTAPRSEIRDDIIPIVINTYPVNAGSTTWTPPNGSINNLAAPIPSGGIGGPSTGGYDTVNAQADYYINGILQTYQATTPQTVQYAWLQPVSLDGAIFQITYSFSESGFFSTISRNTEQIERIVPYKLRRFYSDVNALRKNRQQATRTWARERLRGLQGRGDGAEL